MRHLLSALVMAVLLVSAGCASTSGPAESTPTPSATPTETPSRTPTDVETATVSPTPAEPATPTPDPTPTPEPGPPELTVTVSNSSISGRNYERIINRSVAYWTEDRISRNGAYNATLSFTPDRSPADADIVIELATSADRCAELDSFETERGCTPILASAPSMPTRAVLYENQTNFHLEFTAKRHLGYALGVNRSGPPIWLMPDGLTHDNIDGPEERDHAWNFSRDIRVAIRGDYRGVDQTQTELRRAVTFYNSKEDVYLPADTDLPAGTEFVRVDNWYRAAIVFQAGMPYRRGDVEESVRRYYWLEYDDDRAPEQYVAAYVDVTSIEDS